MTLVAIDPGTVSLGWAEFQGATLVGCGVFVRRTRTIPEFCAEIATAIPTAETVALEHMTAVRERATTPQDLIDVATVGAYAAACVGGRLVLYAPSDWKANITKHIHHARLLEALDEPEFTLATRECAKVGKTKKEILDAIGIGLYHLGRTNKGGSRAVTTPR